MHGCGTLNGAASRSCQVTQPIRNVHGQQESFCRRPIADWLHTHYTWPKSRFLQRRNRGTCLNYVTLATFMARKILSLFWSSIPLPSSLPIFRLFYQRKAFTLILGLLLVTAICNFVWPPWHPACRMRWAAWPTIPAINALVGRHKIWVSVHICRLHATHLQDPYCAVPLAVLANIPVDSSRGMGRWRVLGHLGSIRHVGSGHKHHGERTEALRGRRKQEILNIL